MQKREQSDWIRGFKYGYKVQCWRDRLGDFLAGVAVGVIIAILVRWIA